MSIAARYNFTVDHYRISSVSDGSAGRKDAKTLITASLRFLRFKPDPLIAEAVVTRIGLKTGATVYTAVSEMPAAADIRDNDVLQVSSTEQWRVYSSEPILDGAGNPHHWTLMVVPQDRIVT